MPNQELTGNSPPSVAFSAVVAITLYISFDAGAKYCTCIKKGHQGPVPPPPALLFPLHSKYGGEGTVTFCFANLLRRSDT